MSRVFSRLSVYVQYRLTYPYQITSHLYKFSDNVQSIVNLVKKENIVLSIEVR